jgi:hypothetical protein
LKKLDLAQTITILANVGVIAGILFLGVELQQNNQLLRAEAIGTVLDTRMARADFHVTNPEINPMIAKNVNNEPLSVEERMVIAALNTRGLLGWQKDYFLFQAGILEEEYFRANLPVMKQAFAAKETYGYLEHWTEYWRAIAAPAFQEFIDECVISDCESIPR